MTERPVPWWRRALNYALEGIRSGFGLFPRPAKTEPASGHEPIVEPEENLEEETVLTHQPTNPETATTEPAKPAEPASLPLLVNEPSPIIEPVPAITDDESTVIAAPISLAECPDEPDLIPPPAAHAESPTAAEPPSTAEEPLPSEGPALASIQEQTVGQGFSPDISLSAVTRALAPEVSFSEDSPEVSVSPETSQTASHPLPSESSPNPAIAAGPESTSEELTPTVVPVRAEDPAPVVGQGFSPDISKPEISRALAPEVSFSEGSPQISATPETSQTISDPIQPEPSPNHMPATGAESPAATEPESIREELPQAIDLAPSVVQGFTPDVDQPESAETSGVSEEQGFVTGHDFSRAESAIIQVRALAPEDPKPSPATIIESDPVREADPTPMTSSNPAPVKEPEPVPAPSPEPIPDPPPAPEIEPDIVPVIPIADPPLEDDPNTRLDEPTGAAPAEATEPTPPIHQADVPPANQLPEPPAEPETTPTPELTPKPPIKLETRDNQADLSPFSVVVDQVYDGPLDLLLDLIRKQDIDIYDIPISKITAQFLAYVNQLKASDVDVAGEFIYIASLLIHIKSKMLLPRSPSGPDEAAEDPRRELVERLLEHERFKNAAQMLQQKQMLEAATWTNPGFREFKDDDAAEPEIAADTVDLVRVFRDIIERARNRPVIDIEEDSVTVGQMIQFLARRLTMEDKPVALRRLLSHTRSERALIAMFLALLELVRLQAILLRQDRQFSEIFIKKHAGFDAVMNEGLANARDDWR